jgi:hypothetical protein
MQQVVGCMALLIAGEHVVLDICENIYEMILLIFIFIKAPCFFSLYYLKILLFWTLLNSYHKVGIRRSDTFFFEVADE